MMFRASVIATTISILILSAWGTTGAEDVTVIAHADVDADEISSSRLLDFYTGDIKSWSDGDPVVVFDLKPRGEVRELFYSYLGKSSIRMKSIWMKKLLSGEGDPPEALESEEEMLSRVASTPGAIGFVRASMVNDSVTQLVVIPDSQSK